jgi:transposase-like protein
VTATCGMRSVLPQLRTSSPCDIRTEVLKRNGEPLWWCHVHGTATNGPGSFCPGASTPPIPDDEILSINVDDFPGGVGVWGATPPALTWGRVDLDHGVHVHARHAVGGVKVIDDSFPIVRITSGTESIEIDEESAVAHLVTAIAGQSTVVLECPHCRWQHLDRDQFAVNPHRKHLCNRCGRNFWAGELTISNPLAAVLAVPGLAPCLSPVAATQDLCLDLADYSAVAVWGSNQAIVWTAPLPEADGLHVHAWGLDGTLIIDETYRSVEIDGTALDPDLVRLLMVQRALPELAGRIESLTCPSCGIPHADTGISAFRPHNRFTCSGCGREFRSPRARNIVSNPLLATVAELESGPNTPRNT